MANRRPSKRNRYIIPAAIQDRRSTRRAAVKNEMIFPPTAHYISG